MKSLPQSIRALFFLAGSGFLYYVLLYRTGQPDFFQLILGYGGLFAIYAGALFFLFRKSDEALQLKSKDRPNRLFLYILVPAIVFRLIALFALPQLSDDYFRFAWDGQLLSSGINPFLWLPSELISQENVLHDPAFMKELFGQMNSPDYYTIYPPFCQYVFAAAAFVFPADLLKSTILIKGFQFLAECGSLLLMVALLKEFAKPLKYLALYAWNPLVVVELGGNMHLEGFMIFFLLLSFWLLIKHKWIFATLPFAFAVCSKLLPLMLLPFLIRRLGWQKAILFGLLLAGWILLMFVPFFDLRAFGNLLESTRLYFQLFEFNGSIYYFFRWLLYLITGYNMIAVIGKVSALIVLGSILWIARKEKKPAWDNFPLMIFSAFVLYLGFATTVHPWYLSTIVAMSVFVSFRFGLLWSALIPFTYIAYRGGEFEENLWVVFIEYLLVAILMYWELTQKGIIKGKLARILPFGKLDNS